MRSVFFNPCIYRAVATHPEARHTGSIKTPRCDQLREGQPRREAGSNATNECAHDQAVGRWTPAAVYSLPVMDWIPSLRGYLLGLKLNTQYPESDGSGSLDAPGSSHAKSGSCGILEPYQVSVGRLA